jgi:hypothetical protein
MNVRHPYISLQTSPYGIRLNYIKGITTRERTLLLILVTESTYGSNNTSHKHIPPIMMQHNAINKLFLVEMESLYQFHCTILLVFNACLIE